MKKRTSTILKTGIALMTSAARQTVFQPATASRRYRERLKSLTRSPMLTSLRKLQENTARCMI